jgi:hypothetical protein
MKAIVIIALAFAASASAEVHGHVYAKTVFATGHLFSWGQCAAVATKVSKDCYKAMPAKVFQRIGNWTGVEDQMCVTHIHKTPCIYGEMKYTAETFGAVDCAELVLLYEDAMEECLREDPDARFWLSILYWMAIIVGAAVLSGIVAMLKGCIS